jgi:hypothetical protein
MPLKFGLHPLSSYYAHNTKKRPPKPYITEATIRIEGGQLHKIAGWLLELIHQGGTFFDRGGELVRLSNGRIYPATAGWLLLYGTSLALFEKYDERKKENRPVDCPGQLAKSLCAMAGLWDLPQLTAVITAPVMTPSGRIIERDGYDPETGLYLDFPNPDTWPGIPDKPSDQAVEEAVKALWFAFKEFPFVNATSRGGCLAVLLTATSRRVLPTAPGFLIPAPAAGTGKTLLTLCLAALAGEDPEILPHAGGRNGAEETRKRLLSIARAGTGTIILDNISGSFESDALCAFLTASWAFRQWFQYLPRQR